MNAHGVLHVNNCKVRITGLHLTGLIQWDLVGKNGPNESGFFLLLNVLFEPAAYFIL